MGVTAADFDLDGYPDIYVANDKTENFLFHNKEQRHVSRRSPLRRRRGVRTERREHFGHGARCFRTSTGRTVDLWVSDSKYNRLMKNAGKLQFEDVTQQAGISQLAAQYVSWGTGAHDFDNDGRDDSSSSTAAWSTWFRRSTRFSATLGGGKFEDVSRHAGAFFEREERRAAARRSPITTTTAGWMCFIVNLGAPAFLLHNTSPAAGHWIVGPAGGPEEQPRRHRRAGRGGGGRPAADAGARGGLGISFAGRPSRSFRARDGVEDRPADGHVAERRRSGAAKMWRWTASSRLRSSKRALEPADSDPDVS